MPTYTGDMIRKYRTEKGLTQKKLGELCGIADSNIRKYESGNQNPKIETLQKIADALDIPVNRLLAGKIISRDELKEKLSEYGLTHLVPDTEEERTVLENCKKLIYRRTLRYGGYFVYFSKWVSSSTLFAASFFPVSFFQN